MQDLKEWDFEKVSNNLHVYWKKSKYKLGEFSRDSIGFNSKNLIALEMTS